MTFDHDDFRLRVNNWAKATRALSNMNTSLGPSESLSRDFSQTSTTDTNTMVGMLGVPPSEYRRVHVQQGKH